METQKNQQRKIRILSIDGGGIRGIIPAVILAELENILQKESDNKNVHLSDYFDLIAGTSTGGILTCLYTLPKSYNESKTPRYAASKAVELYQKHGKDIFKKKIFGDASIIFDERYSAKGLETTLNEYLGDAYISSAVKPILVTGYDIFDRKAVFFTREAAKKHEAHDYYFRDVARATSAAPTYFETVKIKSKGCIESCIIDAGLFANDPTMCAIVEMLKSSNEILHRKPEFKDLFIVSLGTGKEQKHYKYEDMKDYGLRWIMPVIDISMSASAEIVSYQLDKFFDSSEQTRNNYVRIDPELKYAKKDMDDVSDKNINNLIDAGHSCALKYIDKLEDIAKKLIKYGI